MLDHITIKGFKSIASIENLELRPINILIGANGSGKSNFLGAFSFLRKICEARLQDYVITASGSDRVLHFGSRTTKEIFFDLSFANKTDQYSLKLSPTEDDGLFPSVEIAHHLNIASALPQRERGLEAGISTPRLEFSNAKWVQAQLGGWRVYHVHDTSSSSPLNKTAKVNDNEFLRPSGSNLAAFLYYLREQHQDSYSMILRTVQQVAPFFKDFSLKRLKLKPDDIKLEWQHKHSDEYFDVSSFSDGTLRFIFLATVFLQPESDRPSIILIDEPELGLHPYAIGLLASLIRQASVNTQVIVSTQSSLLLDYFEPEDVLVADLVEYGTQISRPDPMRLAKWLEDYSLGQLWEKNEIGGRP